MAKMAFSRSEPGFMFWRTMGVFTTPGLTATTRIWWAAHSRASTSVSASTPALAAQ